ncbi:hypothetical protein [Alkalihalobacillus hemicellulosilyticus]|uniref:Aminotransferase n=1 Tax=Halalkalibacter hemicellulosilyticusJCM 9152 TaxID=1236971 RepID=W4QJP4_9BACI|nr:hypothetical protein [Halalkalibacter hemicellulosilyticus]GAE32345.1 aminotransferase [Halalkalibacter hemicellulosilyticusJCM 9152]
MSFQFDEVIDRRGTDSMKWDMTKQRFGGDNLLPLWVADMDFRAPQEILDAYIKKWSMVFLVTLLIQIE